MAVKIRNPCHELQPSLMVINFFGGQARQARRRVDDIAMS
jgi:hypothetical protein